ncbi:MAG TPA: helix-turn-helix domain-containing protein [Woeseiaceae bacterium]|jgi:TetR/AcrR family transcriptional repressor of nem operon|nr:helix-turn-helix domain-containing protein [Woeseiaceae bacterium]
MVRTRAFDPGEALNRAVELFTSRGYSNTSMDDLVKATGVSRYGLYGTFGNKRELFEKALERYADRMGRRSFLRLLEPGAGLVDIRRIFDERIAAMATDSERAGCMLTYTAMELAPRDREIEGVLQRFMKRMSKTFAIGLESAKEKGELPAALDVKAASEFLTGAVFGLAVLARSGFPKETLDRFVDSTLSALR